MIRLSIRCSTGSALRSVLAGAVAVASLAACSSLDNAVSGDKVDYRAAKAKPTPLDVPPDLTQLAVDPRYAPQAGVVSATQLRLPSVAASGPVDNSVAPAAIGEVRLQRDGGSRYLSTPIAPDKLWPQLEAFWQERGLTLEIDQADIGIMETEWAENRAKLPNDIIRNTIGKVIDSLYSTGERDKYRTRVERTVTGGTDIYIVHRGLEEVYADPQQKTILVWRPRATDPTLEGEMLSRLMIKLGVPGETARAATAQSDAASGVVANADPARARVLEGRPAATLQMDEGFDRAWRRVGLALDRSGFTVEDRDRAQGLYYVRYVDPAEAGKEEPGFFAKLFKGDSAKKPAGPIKYRVGVKGEGELSTVSVYDASGAPENGDAGKRIVKLLVDDLK